MLKFLHHDGDVSDDAKAIAVPRKTTELKCKNKCWSLGLSVDRLYV